jgi:hypothetical protein
MEPTESERAGETLKGIPQGGVWGWSGTEPERVVRLIGEEKTQSRSSPGKGRGRGPGHRKPWRHRPINSAGLATGLATKEEWSSRWLSTVIKNC